MSKRVSLPDEPFDYERLIDMEEEQLNDMIKDCEISIERTRTDIIKNYQQAQPYLTKMRLLKNQLAKTVQKMEACKTFLSMEKNGSLVSNIDLSDMKKHFNKDVVKQEEREKSEEESEPVLKTKSVPKSKTGVKTKFKTPTKPIPKTVSKIVPLTKSRATMSLR